MTPHAWQWLWPLFFYLIGSIPAGYLVAKSQGIDIRQHGSGNIGATNVFRVMGRKWGIPVFIFDFLKGFLPLYLLRSLSFPDITTTSVTLLLVACGFCAVLGHNYTPWLGFKGGKGIATSAGMLGALLPWVLVVALSLWVIVTLLTRTVAIGSLVAAFVLAPLAAWFYPHQWIYFTLATLAGGLAVWRHRSNVHKMIDERAARRAERTT